MFLTSTDHIGKLQFTLISDYNIQFGFTVHAYLSKVIYDLLPYEYFKLSGQFSTISISNDFNVYESNIKCPLNVH